MNKNMNDEIYKIKKQQRDRHKFHIKSRYISFILLISFCWALCVGVQHWLNSTGQEMVFGPTNMYELLNQSPKETQSMQKGSMVLTIRKQPKSKVQQLVKYANKLTGQKFVTKQDIDNLQELINDAYAQNMSLLGLPTSSKKTSQIDSILKDFNNLQVVDSDGKVYKTKLQKSEPGADNFGNSKYKFDPVYTKQIQKVNKNYLKNKDKDKKEKKTNAN